MDHVDILSDTYVSRLERNLHLRTLRTICSTCLKKNFKKNCETIFFTKNFSLRLEKFQNEIQFVLTFWKKLKLDFPVSMK